MNGRSTVVNRSYFRWPPPLPPPYAAAATENPPEFLHKFTPAVNLNRSNYRKTKNPYKIHSNETFDFTRSKKSRRFYHQKRRSKDEIYDFAPITPHNTTSFLIRAKRSGGIASLATPYAATPEFSPSTEVSAEAAKEEWGLDGYGSMNGLIRVRLPENRPEEGEDSVVDSFERLSNDVNRFEMVFDPKKAAASYSADEEIERLEEENLILKQRICRTEKEIRELRRRMHLEDEDDGDDSENDVSAAAACWSSEASVGD